MNPASQDTGKVAKRSLGLCLSLWLGVGALAAGCSDSKGTGQGSGGVAGTGGAGTGGIGTGGQGGAGAGPGTGGAGGAGSTPIPLTTWVDDLVIHYSTDDSAPDTVDDKNIKDTDDPAAFDPLLSR